MSAEKATILWHDLWVDGPLVGVAEYNGEKVIFSRNREGKYEIRRFADGGLQKAERHHQAYRATCGHHTDHDPAKFGPRISNAQGTITKTFDYVSNGIADVVVVLDSKDFKWFHPPKKHTPYSAGLPADFNSENVPGKDMQDSDTDSDADEEE